MRERRTDVVWFGNASQAARFALAERGGRLCINPAMLLLAGRQGHHENE